MGSSPSRRREALRRSAKYLMSSPLSVCRIRARVCLRLTLMCRISTVYTCGSDNGVVVFVKDSLDTGTRCERRPPPFGNTRRVPLGGVVECEACEVVDDYSREIPRRGFEPDRGHQTRKLLRFTARRATAPLAEEMRDVRSAQLLRLQIAPPNS